MKVSDVNTPSVDFAVSNNAVAHAVGTPPSNYVIIYNPLDVIIYAKSGADGTVTADATCSFIPPGLTLSFSKDPAHTHISIYSTGSGTVKVSAGEGI